MSIFVYMEAAEITKLLENVTKPIYQIEEQIGIPKTVLQKSMTGKRKLPKKWALLLKDYVARKLYLVGNDTKKKETGQEPLKFQKPTKDTQKKHHPFKAAKINYRMPDENSYDGEKLETNMDEMAKYPTKPLSKIEQLRYLKEQNLKK